jgi:cytochrome b561
MGYSPVAKWFHWVTVGLMAVVLPFGFVIGHVKDSDKMAFYAIHESVGLTLLAVALARLAYRLRNPPPGNPRIARPLRLVAETVHHALYAALIAQPVLGFLATNAFGFPMQGATAYLGLIDLPKFMEANEPLANALLTAHRYLGWSIAALLAAHIGGAILHQAILKDETLLRMV